MTRITLPPRFAPLTPIYFCGILIFRQAESQYSLYISVEIEVEKSEGGVGQARKETGKKNKRTTTMGDESIYNFTVGPAGLRGFPFFFTAST